MTSLLDVAPLSEKVTVGSSEIMVFGVSAKGVAALLARFPDLRSLISGREVEAERILEFGGDVVAAIIAAACGYPGDEKAEAVASSLSVDAQADLLQAAMRLTLPKGLGPLVEKLVSMGILLNVEDAALPKVPVSKLRKR